MYVGMGKKGMAGVPRKLGILVNFGKNLLNWKVGNFGFFEVE